MKDITSNALEGLGKLVKHDKLGQKRKGLDSQRETC